MEPRLCNLSGLVTLTEPLHKEPSILDPLKLIDPINIQTDQICPSPPLKSPHTHSITGINIDYHL